MRRQLVFDRFANKLDGVCLVAWKDHKNHKKRGEVSKKC